MSTRPPVQAPNANAFVERWVQTVRQEYLDWVLIWSRRHLERVLDEYVRHYNNERPHLSLALRPPRGIDIEVEPDGPRPPSASGAGIVWAAWFTSTTRSRHDVRVSEPNGVSVMLLSCGNPVEPAIQAAERASCPGRHSVPVQRLLPAVRRLADDEVQ
jgi:hypothetical protein